MASIEKHEGKNGITYRITVYAGFDSQGKRVRHRTTWKPKPGMTARQMEKAAKQAALEFEQSLEQVQCIFFNGAQGDVNHVNVHPRGGYLNDMFIDFDDVARGYEHARYMGRVVTGGVLQAYDKVKYVDVEHIRCKRQYIRIPSNMPKQEELEEAYRINQLHIEGKDEELPYTGMMLTTKVAAAARMIRLEHGPQYFDMELTGIAIGDVVLLGIPGEPFTGVGRALKAVEGCDLILPTCNTNGKQGYFPMQEAYDEGGYESGSSNFRAGVAELIIDEGKKLIEDIHSSIVGRVCLTQR